MSMKRVIRRRFPGLPIKFKPIFSSVTMSRFAALLVVIPLLFGGCALCTNCGDDDYSAYGGRWERDIANEGRVGSVFATAGYRVESDPEAEPIEAEAR
jgi:hypothetical protein